MKSIIYFCAVILAINLFSCNHEEKQKITEGSDCCKNIDSTATSINANKESLYQIEGEWTNQNGEKIELKKLSGKVQVLAMIFTNCSYACPKIISDIQTIESKIPHDKLNKVNFLLISFDVVRDSPEKLNTFGKEMKLNENWMLLHGTEQLVQEMSVVLGVKFEKQEDGSFAHSNIITVLDQNGAIAYQQEGLGANSEDIMKVITDIAK